MIHHIDKHSPSITLRNTLLSASNDLLYGFAIAGKKSLGNTTYESGTNLLRNWGILKHTRVVSPTAFALKHFNYEEFDNYNFEFISGYEDLHLFADYLIVNEDITVREFDPDDNEHVVADIMASAIHCMMIGEIRSAYAYLASVQTFLASIQEVQDDKTEPEATEVDINPFEL